MPMPAARRAVTPSRGAAGLRASRRTLCARRAQAREGAYDAVVVGAGMAGLACALALKEGDAGARVALVDAADAVGGRVRTDVTEDGFTLDRGFHIFLTSYPQARATFDYEALDLKPFYAGADVHFDGAFHRVADPFRHPLDGVASLPNPIGTVADKVRVGLLRFQTLLSSNEDILAGDETTTEQALRDYGFTDAMIDRFFRPFIGGIYFDRSLQVTSRLLLFVLRMLATGQNCLPAAGIGACAAQLGERAQAAGVDVRLNARVESVEGGEVRLADGTVLTARRGVVVATEEPEARRLLGDAAGDAKGGEPRGTCCVYYDVPGGPPEAFAAPILYLDGDGSNAVVNNATFLSEVVPGYAPAGHGLLSASTLSLCSDLADDAALDAAVRADLSRWFGAAEVARWRTLRTYRIPYAQPPQSPPTCLRRPPVARAGVYRCGDWTASSTLDGALSSGVSAAAALLAGS